MYEDFLKVHNPNHEEYPFFEYAQVFTASSIWYKSGIGKQTATFDLTIREMPGERNFMILGGVEEIVSNILNWKYEPKAVDFLVSKNIISEEFGQYLKNFKFSGDVWAMPEGTVFFPGEPIVRITAQLQDANLLTTFLANCVCYPTLFFSKLARVKLAAGNKSIVSAGATRANAFENMAKAHRIAYILETGLSVPWAIGRLDANPSFGSEVTLYHALIKSFPSEKEAFRAILQSKDNEKNDYSTMIDTYDIKQGLNNFIEVEKEAQQEGKSLCRAVIDSGDILELSKWVRAELNKNGLEYIKVVAASNLDEYKIDYLEKNKAPIDMYGAVTEVMNVSDRPVLEAVYKLAQTVDGNGNIKYAAKLTPGKESLPGAKQVFRNYDKDGKIAYDKIGMEEENLGKRLLVGYIKKGEIKNDLPSLEEIRNYVKDQLDELPAEMKKLGKAKPYAVKVSEKLEEILEEVRAEHVLK